MLARVARSLHLYMHNDDGMARVHIVVINDEGMGWRTGCWIILPYIWRACELVAAQRPWALCYNRPTT